MEELNGQDTQSLNHGFCLFSEVLGLGSEPYSHFSFSLLRKKERSLSIANVPLRVATVSEAHRKWVFKYTA